MARASYLKMFAELIRANRVELAGTLAGEQAKILPLARVGLDVSAEVHIRY